MILYVCVFVFGVIASAQSNDLCMLFVPNAFTPNEDGLNDLFFPVGLTDFNSEGYSMQIYNREGVLLFESNNYSIGWDGKTSSGDVVSNGIYIYFIQYHDYCEHSEIKQKERKGYVALLR